MKNKLFASKELIEYAFIQSIHISESNNKAIHSITKESIHALGADECMNIYMKHIHDIGIDYEYLYKLSRDTLACMISFGLTSLNHEMIEHFKKRYTPIERAPLSEKWPSCFNTR